MPHATARFESLPVLAAWDETPALRSLRLDLGPAGYTENYLGHDDWRLPNAKELHSRRAWDKLVHLSHLIN